MAFCFHVYVCFFKKNVVCWLTSVLAHRDFLIIAPYKYSYLLTYLPAIWNSLPQSIRDADSVACFKRRIKSHYFEDYYL